MISLAELRCPDTVCAVPQTARTPLDAHARTLHIRCGHDIMEKLALAGFQGDFLWFADPYVQGPVPRLDSLEAFVRIRAQYLGALARHLRELPSARNGLSLTEEITLRMLTQKGPARAPRLFGWYTNEYEPLPFLGDTGYWTVLQDLANAREPAIRIREDAGSPAEENRHWCVELLPFGERLLAGEVDWLRSNTVERWVGGVRIDSRQPRNWRFDESRGVLEA